MAVPSSELSAEDHLRLAHEFLAFADWLNGTGRMDSVTVGWAVTNAYYASLHAASGYVLAHHGARVETHADRARWFNPGAFPEFSRVDRGDYLQLKKYSEMARYQGVPFVWLQYTALRTRAGQFVAKWSARASTP